MALGTTACGISGPQDALQPEGFYAERADFLWDVASYIAIAIFFIVEGALVFTILKFRRRPGREAAQFHGNTPLEVVLTIIPALILAGLAVPTVRTIFQLHDKPEGALEITVVGHQFWWEYRYTGVEPEVVTANEMHIPTGRDVYLQLEGVTDDVNHSFWVPRLAGAQDIIPGRENHILLRADEADTYWGQCKEYCGLSHANMRHRVVAESPDEFEQWLADQQEPAREPPAGLAAQGKEAFLGSACIGCHTVAGTEAASSVGPNLTHLASRETFAAGTFPLNEKELTEWVADAPGKKPGVRMPSGVGEMGLSDQEVRAIVAYLLTLE